MRRIRMLEPDALPTAGVVRAAEVDGLLKAARVIAEAEAWAEDGKRRFQERLDRATSDAADRAYDDGLAALSEAAKAYRAAVVRLEGRLETLLADGLGRLFADRPAEELVGATVGPAIRAVAPDADMRIVIAPDRVEALEAALAAAEGFAERVEIETGADVAPGECSIYTETDVLDVSDGVVVDRLVAALLRRVEPAAGALS